MIFLEFAAQGVRGVAPAGGRATLRPGYNVLAADGALLRRLVEALLYPDPHDGDALPRASGGPANAPMRAGLTLVGNDRITYRLVRDFATGAQLHRFDPAKRSFALVAQELPEIAAFLHETVGVPPASRLGALLALSQAELPSKAGGAVAAAGAATPQRTSLTPEQARKRIAQLGQELERAKAAEKLQYQQDALQGQLYKLDEALRGGARIREGLEKAEAARAELGQAVEIAKRLGDADTKIAAYEKATARREEAAAKVSAEREAMGEVEARGAPAPFWRDPLFWAGAGAGVGLALIGALGAAAHPDVRYVALLDVPAFGFAAWTALRWVGGLEEWERRSRRKKVVDEWEKKVEAQYEKDAAEVREAGKALGLTKPSDLRDALARVADADAVVAEWRKRLADWEASAEAKAAAGERARVEEALRGVEAKLSEEAGGGFVRDVRSVEAELQRLEAEAAAPPAAAPPPPVQSARPVPTTEPIRGLLARAAAELGGSPSAAARAVAARASQVLSGISFQRLQAVQVDDRGNVNVQTGGRVVPGATLAPADRDAVFVALKLAFLEQALAPGKLVAVIDDAFGGFTEGSRRFVARLLKQAARPGQILHATSDPSFREAADHAA